MSLKQTIIKQASGELNYFFFLEKNLKNVDLKRKTSDIFFLSYKKVLQTNDDRYFKYLITNFKFLYNIIYDFYIYLRLNNKYVDEIDKLLNIKILLDTETTGLFNYDSVLQLSYVIFNDFDLLKTFNKIIKINPKIKIKNSFIHGITNEHCKLGEPCNIVMAELHEDFKICKTIVGHKVDFDLRMLSNEFKRSFSFIDNLLLF